MSDNNTLKNIKKLREITGVGFKDCKIAIDENKGDIEKSIEYLRKKGIAKASKKMSRVASEGLVAVCKKEGSVAIIEVNSETDFVAKNKDFIKFCTELAKINLTQKGDLDKLKVSKMENNLTVEENLVGLISKIGEKITIRRSKYFDNRNGMNYVYVHSEIEKNLGKIASMVKLKSIKDNDVGLKLAMHITALNPLSIGERDLKKEILDKEKEIIEAELKESGKKTDIVEKISKGRIRKFIEENTLLHQSWIIDPKKKVSEILNAKEGSEEVVEFIRFKVGEGV